MTHTPATTCPQQDTAPDGRPDGSPPRGRGLAAWLPARSPKPPPRPDIQALRGLAVTLVVLAHAGVTFAAGGYVGVDVFFVISGFLITSGLLREADRSGTLSLRRFYARRAVRILPLATLVSLATMIGCRLFASKVRYAEFMHDALAGALYFVNIDLADSGTDYLREGSSPSPFQHLWSLSVEEQFYLLWPLLLLVSWKLIRRPWLRALPLGVLCVLSYVLGVRATETSPPGRTSAHTPVCGNWAPAPYWPSSPGRWSASRVNWPPPVPGWGWSASSRRRRCTTRTPRSPATSRCCPCSARPW